MAGFWNNEFGWTTYEQATLFSQEEKRTLSLPIGAGEVKWENREHFAHLEAQKSQGQATPEALPVLEVTLKVTYNLNGASFRELKAELESRIYSAIGNGMLSGDSEAEVDTYHLQVQEVRS